MGHGEPLEERRRGAGSNVLPGCGQGGPGRVERDAPGPDLESGFAAEPAATGGLTLVEGATFAVCGPGGDMDPRAAHGLFVRDARIISRWHLQVDGAPVDVLRGFTAEPFAGVFMGRARTREGRIEPTVIVERRRYVGTGMREDVIISNFGPENAGLTVSLLIEADFADLFTVKVGNPAPPGPITVEAVGSRWQARFARSDGGGRAVSVEAAEAVATPAGLSFRVVVPAHGTWRSAIAVSTSIDGQDLVPRFPADQPIDRTVPVRRISAWRRQSPVVEAESPALTAALLRSETDLAALRIFDPRHPDIRVVAAGAPWFMALFGRDSLITSAMMLPVNTDLAVGTLRTLAHYQGTKDDPLTEEQPGRILHEMRFGTEISLALGGANCYYGTADATPLFVLVLGELARWGVAKEILEELLPAADRALGWIEDAGDRDGDGFVEYLRATDRGLRNQGWKDSADGVTFADGTLAEPPIALVEVQAYVYGAYRARALLARMLEAPQAAVRWDQRATAFKARFNETFWMEDRGYFAMGLDADKRPIDALASNMGHCLWTGVVDDAKAAHTARQLLSPVMFSGYGIRTLATTMAAYNPASYHNGSIWPHDNALAVAGLVRYGHVAEAQQVAAALIDASAFFAGRLPELFCGFDRGDLPGPVPYPTSCSPQAWASAAPVALVSAMLGLDPDVPSGRIVVSPHPPSQWGALRVANIHVGEQHLSVTVDGDGAWKVAGADDLVVEDRPVSPRA